MNLSEAAAFRALKAEVETLKRHVTELTRRIDDLSKTERARTDRETLSLKKANG